jgi:hypothetical protein
MARARAVMGRKIRQPVPHLKEVVLGGASEEPQKGGGGGGGNAEGEEEGKE